MSIRFAFVVAESTKDLAGIRVETFAARFFAIAGVRLVRGRNFHDLDGAPGAETVIINERLAARFFPGEDPSAPAPSPSQRREPPCASNPREWRRAYSNRRLR